MAAPPQAPATDEEQPCGDCVVEKVMMEGLCKQEFLAFDTCYDANSQNEEPCMDLFDAFRDCMRKRATVDKVVQQAMG